MKDKLEEARERELSVILQRKFETVTPELFSEFLYIKGVPVVRCLMCGSEDMGIPQQTSHINPLMNPGVNSKNTVTYVDPVKVDGGGARFTIMNYEYRVICRNCGFVSSFAAWPVMNWIELKSAKGDADER